MRKPTDGEVDAFIVACAALAGSPNKEERARILKDRLFSIASDGCAYFLHRKIWDSIDVIARAMTEAGRETKWRDFLRPVAGSDLTPPGMIEAPLYSDSLLPPGMVAVRDFTACLSSFFSSSALWGKDIEEMNAVYLTLDRRTRVRALPRDDYLGCKRRAATAAGMRTREDELRSGHVTLEVLERVIVGDDYYGGGNGAIRCLNGMLRPSGLSIRKSDLFLIGSDGDAIISQKHAWTRLLRHFRDLKETGEILGADDFLKEAGGGKTALHYACEHAQIPHWGYNALSRLFDPEIWAGRVDEMISLYDRIKDIPVNPYLCHAPQLEALVDLVMGFDSEHDFKNAAHTLESLVKPLNDSNSGTLIRPTGTKIFWENIGDVVASLRQRGESLTLDHLRLVSGRNQESALMTAARHGKFEAARDIVRAAGQYLDADDLLFRNRKDVSLLQILCEKRQEAQIFRTELWTHDPEGMMRVYRELPEAARTAINIRTVLGDITIARTRRKFPVRLPEAAP